MRQPEQTDLTNDTEVTHALSVLVREFIDNYPHRIQATALLSAYIQTAIANPCCTENCLAQLGKAVLLLAKAIDSNHAKGQPLH